MCENPDRSSVRLEMNEIKAHGDAANSALAASRTSVAANGLALEDRDTTSPVPGLANHRPWDYSNRKVIVQGVDKFHNAKTATKMVHTWLETKPEGLQFTIDKIKKPPKSTWMTITLQNENMVEPLIEYINSGTFRNRKGNKVFAKSQTESTDGDRDRRRSREEDVDNGDNELDDTVCRSESTAQLKRPRLEVSDNTGIALARRPIHVEELKDRIIPLWKLSPDEQLQYKMKEMIKKCAMKIINEIKSKFRALGKEKSRSKMELYPWILQQRCIDVQPIVTAPSPLRNKCEFTFGYQYSWPSTTEVVTADIASTEPTNVTTADTRITKIPAVGFMVTGWAGGVSFSNSLPNIPLEAGAIVDIVNSFLISSRLAPYDCTNHCGFWRILTVRVSRRTRECMIIIQHNSPTSAKAAFNPDLADIISTEDPLESDLGSIFASERERLISLLVEAELPTALGESCTRIKVTSIFFQEFSGLSNPSPEHPVQHVYGKEYLTEQLGSCFFQISPGAFFQVNTEGAEMLYQLVVDKIREIAPDPGKTLLFDVCCGTGTIGLTCLKAGVVGQVVGVDISEPAIMDAKRNASLNGYSTEGSDHSNHDSIASVTRFVASRAELIIGREIHRAKQQQLRNDGSNGKMQFVAVVDPAREGLHADVIKAIRSNNQICHLVYVSCNPTATLVRDAALLCSPPTKRYTGRPFRIVAATPVDMFPLTNHCEMVMTFHRLSDIEMVMNEIGDKNDTIVES